MANWPKMLPYPYSIQRSRGKVPNASAVDWPQAQFAPLYLPPGSPSFQPYVYRDKPTRFPAGAKVFSIWPGPDNLRLSTKLMNTPLRRWGMARPDGDTIRVPHYGHRARRNTSVGASAGGTWKFGDTLNFSADIGWGDNLSATCKAAYLARRSDAQSLWQDHYNKHKNQAIPQMRDTFLHAGRGAYIARVRDAQKAAEDCMEDEQEAREDAEYQQLRKHKVETQHTAAAQHETAAQQAAYQAQLAADAAALESAEARTKLITYGTLSLLAVGGLYLFFWRE